VKDAIKEANENEVKESLITYKKLITGKSFMKNME
jgi:hypothetical protein